MASSVEEAFRTFVERLTPTPQQRERGASHRGSVESALRNRLSVNRFFESGSFHHGTGIRYYSDIDAFVSLGNRPGSPQTALNWVKDALQTRFPLTTVKIRRPAVVVEFSSGYETWEVIPAFYRRETNSGYAVYDIPAPGGEWIESSPRSHLAYVTEVNGAVPRGKAKELARLIKAWKYYCNVPISSFYLEMKAAKHVKGIDAYIAVWDVCLVLEHLRDIALAAMNDPAGAVGRFYPCSSTANKTEAMSKVNTAATRARKALNAYRDDDVSNALYYLDLLFGGQFPS
jgi:hypothetical protein